MEAPHIVSKTGREDSASLQKEDLPCSQERKARLLREALPIQLPAGNRSRRYTLWTPAGQPESFQFMIR